MSSETFQLVIHSGVVEGAVITSDRVVRSHRVENGLPRLDESWGDDLSALDEAVAHIVRTLGIAPGTPTTVVYSSPRTAVEVFQVPARGREAFRAATISLSEALGVAAEFGAVGVKCLWQSGGAGAARSMMLAAGEPDTTPETVCALLERAGLQARTLVPMRAAAILACWKNAHESPDRNTVLIDLGPEHTTMIGIVDGELRLVRQIAVGSEMCIDAYERAMRASRTDAEPPPMRSDAARAFWRHGVPSRNTEVDGYRTKGGDVLPLLQPIMQRLSVEIKQTLRFGLDTEGKRVAVRLVGVAAATPCLAAILSDDSDCAIEALPFGGACTEPSDPGALAWALGTAIGTEINLLPRAHVERKLRTTLRRTALIGAGVAMIAMAIETGLVGRSVSEARAELGRIRPEAAVLREQREARASASKLADVLEKAERNLSRVVGERTDWYGLLSGITAAAGESVSLSDISCTYDKGTPVATIRGQADATPQTGDALRAFMDAIAAYPGIERVTLGATRLQEIDGHASKGFSIVIHLKNPSVGPATSGGTK